MRTGTVSAPPTHAASTRAPQLQRCLVEESPMAGKKSLCLLLCLCSLLELARAACEKDGRPVACYPSREESILVDLEPEASDTCGLTGRQRFCYQTSDGRTKCENCDASVPEQSHPPSLMTDRREGDNVTFWLSFAPSAVVTFPLSKKFQIESVSLTFHSLRPESFAIFKSTDYGVTFVPFRYFSLSCEATYGVEEEESSAVALGGEPAALCSSAEAGGTSEEALIFRPLEHGPTAGEDGRLREWALATHLQLRLDRRQTETQFYAVSDVEVSGTCFCNGHAGNCSGSVAGGDVECACEHGTAGRDCGECGEFNWATPWAPATPNDPASCMACPACYDQVAVEFNKTRALLSSLLSSLNSSAGQIPADLLREIQDYQLIVEEMLQRATELASQERNLTSSLSLVAMETDDAEDLIGRLERNVSLSEEGLARVRAQSVPAAQLLQRLRGNLEAVERAVRVDLVASLSLASQQLQEIESLFADLVNLSLLANGTSSAHLSLALDLVSSARGTAASAQQALDLLSLTLSLQNSTSAIVERLVEEQQGLELIFRDARVDLAQAGVTVSSVLSQSRALLDRLGNISTADYDTTELEIRLEQLRNLTDDLTSDTASVQTELQGVEGEVGQVRERAALLLAESESLNLLAVELLARAHAALSFANQTAEEGDQFVGSVEETLAQLQLRLENSSGFVSGLEEVVQNVLLAERLVGEAEGEGEKRRMEVSEAIRTAEEAVNAFEDASRLTTQALEVALSVREEATRTLFNATLLTSQAEQLAENVSAVEDRGAELEGVAMESEELLTMATGVAQSASSDASRLQGEIDQLLRVLEELQVDLNSTELLPGKRLSEVGSMVTELEARADSVQLTLDALQDQVGQLEGSSEELRERHEALQQHRDLLQTILGNIQNLDCRNQFQSI